MVCRGVLAAMVFLHAGQVSWVWGWAEPWGGQRKQGTVVVIVMQVMRRA